jgi:hypothetical protein
MEGKNGNIYYQSKFYRHFISGGMGINFAGMGMAIIALIRFVLIIIFEVHNIPNKNSLLIGPIILLIFLFSFGIFLAFFIKKINQKSQHPLYIRTLLISFIVSLILLLLLYWHIVSLP